MNIHNRFRFKKKQAGVSLIELMIGMTIGLIVTAGVLQLFVSTLVGSRELLSQARLETELSSIAHFMANDLRRAGYWGDEGKTADWGSSDRNPFIEAIPNVEALAVDEMTGETADSCVLYAYNLDGIAEAGNAQIGFCASCALPGSGAFTSGGEFDNDNLEMFGYRLNDGVVEMRTGPGSSTTYTCNDGEWTPLSDSSVISITALSFTTTESLIDQVTAEDGSVFDIHSLDVDVQITGTLTADSSVEKNINTTVRVANTRVSE